MAEFVVGTAAEPVEPVDADVTADADMDASIADPAPATSSDAAATAAEDAPPDSRVGQSVAPQVINRIKRAQGQLGGVLRMLEEGRDTHEVVNQLKAVTSALDRAGFAIIAEELRTAGRRGIDEDDLGRLERLFLSLA